ncbi:3-ketodihydrosphingosine reductase-like protein, partial [Euroglyphus maynei]
NIRVTVSFPPDTDTPGFANEQHGKPKITELISDEGGLFTPEQVAEKSLKDCLNNQFISTIGMNGFVVTTLCSGMMPCYSWSQRLIQILLMSPLRAIGLHFLYSCEKIVRKNYREKCE